MKIRNVASLSALILLFPAVTLAHCPLCTAGAGAAAIAATYLGVSTMAVGVFIGAFAIALGFWISKLIKKQYIPHQRKLIILISFLTTVLPLLPIMPGYSSMYISFMGDYGSLLNRTYLLNDFLLGSIIGGAVILIAPYISKKVSVLRKGAMLPFQGIVITFVLLIVTSLVIEFAI